MKNLLFYVLLCTLIISCAKDDTLIPNAVINVDKTSILKGNKVDVCHNGNIINVNVNALPGHQAHGDAVDIDGDGYFDIDNPCSETDCDDSDNLVNPAAEEICDDETDNNCDGEVDEGCISFVTICEQDWMINNLDVSTYRNGDEIPRVDDASTWASLTTGAYCYYNNDSTTYATIYGKLYNWYAVNDSRGLAPDGWHVPTDAEWATLPDCLGGYWIAGGKMKETGLVHWLSPNTGATNESGFTGLPGGQRNEIGTFRNESRLGYFWSSSDFDNLRAWYRDLRSFSSDLDKFRVSKRYGLSVRCLRD